jgi:hypothetical protein
MPVLVSRRSPGKGYPISLNSAGELDTVPNTPPCILIVLIACSWLDRSVAPQRRILRPKITVKWPWIWVGGNTPLDHRQTLLLTLPIMILFW